MYSLKVVFSALSGSGGGAVANKPENGGPVVKQPQSGNVTISNTPTVTSSGQVVWSNRDVLFNPDRLDAAKIFQKNGKDEK
jgi:hypothetical protein